MLRTVHHARRIEQSLLCYERSSWLEERKEKKREEKRKEKDTLMRCEEVISDD